MYTVPLEKMDLYIMCELKLINFGENLVLQLFITFGVLMCFKKNLMETISPIELIFNDIPFRIGSNKNI